MLTYNISELQITLPPTNEDLLPEALQDFNLFRVEVPAEFYSAWMKVKDLKRILLLTAFKN